MITKDLKISKMLERYPETLKVLLNASPHFKKLNNTFLRKTLAGRVNVEQAAGIAGVPLKELLINLNFAIGDTAAIHRLTNEEEDMSIIGISNNINEKPEYLKNISPGKIVDLDVRNEIASGKDPIHKIKGVINNLKEDEVFHLINSFEPVPLYTVLGNKGFKHWTEKNGEVWNVYFYKDGTPVLKQGIKNDDSNIQSKPIEGIVELDVRNFQPPEPMIKILEMLPQLSDDTILLVHHHREPVMLYDKLAERGYTAAANKIEENYYKIVITKVKEE